jgi:hypothetical protein
MMRKSRSSRDGGAERFVLEFQAPAKPPASIIRIRPLLKYAWRALGMRCTRTRVGEDKSP